MDVRVSCGHCAGEHDTASCTLRTPQTQAIMDAAREAQVLQSRGERGRTRRASIERYLWQFMNDSSSRPRGENSSNYSTNYDKIDWRIT